MSAFNASMAVIGSSFHSSISVTSSIIRKYPLNNLSIWQTIFQSKSLIWSLEQMIFQHAIAGILYHSTQLNSVQLNLLSCDPPISNTAARCPIDCIVNWLMQRKSPFLALLNTSMTSLYIARICPPLCIGTSCVIVSVLSGNDSCQIVIVIVQ